ncbi:MAG TPA: potassium-transporting ATPase subunit KdpB [Spirochaetia bacterium]|nr:potassium-transporting ATPase subunit KdpB [Spirochaetia bacterium]
MRHEIRLLSIPVLSRAVGMAFAKLDPRVEIKNPVMFMVWIGSVFISLVFITDLIRGIYDGFNLQIAIWLWFTVLFANFSESLAEIQGKARADALRAMRTKTVARRLLNGNGKEEKVASIQLRVGDRVICEAGDVIPGDGEVIEGIASVDESAITGESAPVIRESGGDRSAVTGGTKVISDRIVVRITSEQGKTFVDRLIGLVENATRQKTPGEIALQILLSSFSIIFLAAVGSLWFFASYSAKASGTSVFITTAVLFALLVCLIPTTIGGLLSAIGISSVSRLIKKNVLALSGRAVDAAGDIDVMLLDKTGTVTMGNRMASSFLPAKGSTRTAVAEAALLASLADETPEGRSIVNLARHEYAVRAASIQDIGGRFVPFSAKTRMSGLDFDDERRSIRKGAAEAVKEWVVAGGGRFPADVDAEVTRISAEGGTPLAVARGNEVLGVIHLKDVVKGGIKDRLFYLRKMGIRSVMITGDNPLTAATIAAEAGVDDYIAEATPQAKLERIRAEQKAGHLVAMIGDGTNDAPALAQADVGVAMSSGTQVAREAGNMVDLDSNPTKLIDIVEVGKEQLMTRGALTTFSIANDVAKFFAILPAMFVSLYAAAGTTGPLWALNVMKLASPQSAVLSAVIFNALIIVALIPLALRGVRYRAVGAIRILRRNLLIYGLGGIIAPFIGIKAIDLLVHVIGLA